MTIEEKLIIKEVNVEVDFWQGIVNKFNDGDTIVNDGTMYAGVWAKTGKAMDYSLSRGICASNERCDTCLYTVHYGRPCLEDGWIRFLFNPTQEFAEHNRDRWLTLLADLVSNLAKKENYEQIEELLKTKEEPWIT
jgi:hypothetical protein